MLIGNFWNCFELLIEVSFKAYLAKYFLKFFFEIAKIVKEIVYYMYYINLYICSLIEIFLKKIILSNVANKRNKFESECK